MSLDLSRPVFKSCLAATSFPVASISSIDDEITDPTYIYSYVGSESSGHTFSGRDRNRKLRHLWRRRRMNLSQLKSPGRRKTTSQPDAFSNSR
ncbi:hypothetical protein IC582_002623 [Cucumis melo]